MSQFHEKTDSDASESLYLYSVFSGAEIDRYRYHRLKNSMKVEFLDMNESKIKTEKRIIKV